MPSMLLNVLKQFMREMVNIYFDQLKSGGIFNKIKIVSEYDQEIPQSQTADNPVALRGRAAQPSRDTRKTN